MGQIIRTATGTEYEIEWCGVASFDGILRFYVPNGNIVELMTAFSNPENLPVTHIFDGTVVETYTNYTVFFGAIMDFVGGVTVSLVKE